MSGQIAFQLPGHPKGKGRPRSFSRVVTGADGKPRAFTRHYTPEETQSYEGMIRLAAEKAMRGRPPIERPVIVYIAAVFDIPKTFSKKRRAMALDGGEFPAKKPDLDNIAKVTTDALNGVVYKDDAQIVSARLSKVYGPAPMVRVAVTPL